MSTSSFAYLMLISLSCFFFLLCFKPSRKHRLPPGPTPWPIFGSLFKMQLTKPHFRFLLSVADGRDITCVRLGYTNAIIVNSPTLALEFLKKHDASFASRPLSLGSEYSGRGFLAAAVAPWGDHWKKMRRILVSEVLSPAKHRYQQVLRLEEANHFTKYLYNESRKKSVIDIRSASRYYGGNVIRRLLFRRRWLGEEGKRLGVPGKEEVEHVEASLKIISKVFGLCPSDYLPVLRWLDLDGHERLLKMETEKMNKYHDPIIDERMNKWRRSSTEKAITDAQDILDVLILAKNDEGKPLLTKEEIKAESAEFMYAGIDNFTNAVEWALAHILHQPEILGKAVEELDNVVGKHRLVQESDFPQLVYLKACAREAFRLHPVGAFNLPHLALHDTEVAGYFIPKGSHVMVSRFGLGRNPETWPDPLRFDPERHMGSTNVVLAEPQLRFMSFGAGRRGCVGSELGSALTYTMLARLLHSFEWTLSPDETIAGIDFSEEKKSLYKERPLRLVATPRLEPKLFEQI